MRPKALDLYCKAGGASKGLYQAGFDVTGVDIEPQPHYPFTFIQADALTIPLDGFDFYWASPVCKAFSQARFIHPELLNSYPNHIPSIRERLRDTGKPYIIENVPGAPLLNPITLCGTMFGLRVRRHRLFECSPVFYPFLPPCACKGKAGYTAASDGFSSFANGAKLISVAGHNFSVPDAKVAMGIDWMNQEELSQAVPPVFALFIASNIWREK